MPNFLIIGAPRSGTTTLHEELKRQPQIFMSSIKEPLFFAVEGESEPFQRPRDDQGIRGLKTYCSLFSGVRDEKAIGEASPLYFYSQKASYRIKHYIPNVKLIAILRNLIDRAYSHFLLHKLLGKESLNDFREAIEAEEERERMRWSPYWFYRKMGLYSEQLARYFSLFRADQIKVFLFEDLQQNPKNLFKDIAQFLDIDGGLVIKASARHNVYGYPMNVKLNTFLTQPNFISTILRPFLSEKARLKLRLKVWDVLLRGLRQSNLRKPELQPEVREWLIEYYREDTLRTQDILKRDLSHWLKIPVRANKDNHN
ncbi:MAG: sulfotransferase domain-containing protein [Ignavibacteriales bacterium]